MSAFAGKADIPSTSHCPVGSPHLGDDMVGGCHHQGQWSLQCFDVNCHQSNRPMESRSMWSQWMVDSWGYGGYGPFHMIIWMIIVVAAAAGVVWRIVSAQQKKSNSR